MDMADPAVDILRSFARGTLSRRAVIQLGLQLGLSMGTIEAVLASTPRLLTDSSAHTPTVQQAPLRNASIVGAGVYSHSGEFSTTVTDLAIPGRGLSLRFVRHYRSGRQDAADPFGPGWTFTYAKRVQRQGDSILYHDGSGRTHLFLARSHAPHFQSPPGAYALLSHQGSHLVLRARYGLTLMFDLPETGGRLRSIGDLNDNTIRFQYAGDTMLVTDPLGHQVTLTYRDGRVVEMRDEAPGRPRVWTYDYDADGYLQAVVLPATHDSPKGTRLRYGYDANHRLNAIYDGKNQRLLFSTYNDRGQVKSQQHGAGTYHLAYTAIGATTQGRPIYRTDVTLKNGAHLSLEHNAGGQVTKSILLARAALMSPEDRAGAGPKDLVPLTTTSRYNGHGELLWRRYPYGHSVICTYDEANSDPRARGNRRTAVRYPAPAHPLLPPPLAPLVTRYDYHPDSQFLAKLTDPRGHATSFGYDERGNLRTITYPPVTVQPLQTTKPPRPSPVAQTLKATYAYNEAGQLIRATDPRGVVTEYGYYPADDPTGARGGLSAVQMGSTRPGGYLGRIVQDPAGPGHTLSTPPVNGVTEFGYDAYGNLTLLRDGNGRPTRFRYDPLNRLIGATARHAAYALTIRYDANGRPRRLTLPIDRNEYDPKTGTVAVRTSPLDLYPSYNVLGYQTGLTIRAGDHAITHTVFRDAADNVSKYIDPLGYVSTYGWDERGLLVERRRGVGRREESVTRATYTPSGRLRSATDARRYTTRYLYDRFGRFIGSIQPDGTRRSAIRDNNGNIRHLTVTGRVGAAGTGPAKLYACAYTYDELDRSVRQDVAWFDPATGAALGYSAWDGVSGQVSRLIEYAANHRPARVWDETDNVLSISYDGADRVAAMGDLTGLLTTFGYDPNGNLERVEQTVPAATSDQAPFHSVTMQTYNALDRLATRSTDGEPARTFTYNVLGAPTSYTNQVGDKLLYLHDGFGRWVGQAIAYNKLTTTLTSRGPVHKPELSVTRLGRDDNGRITSLTGPAGPAARMRYGYDALGRLTSIADPLGNVERVMRDGNGNIHGKKRPTGYVITQSFDPMNRLTGRAIQLPGQHMPTRHETFGYDGQGRLVTATASGLTLSRAYDSRSRLLSEAQGHATVTYRYDGAGNRRRVVYPSGRIITRTFDARQRLETVSDGGTPLVTYTYYSLDAVEQKTYTPHLWASYGLDKSGRYATDVTLGPDHDIFGNYYEQRYGYDNAGRLNEKTIPTLDNFAGPQTWTYGYDERGHMTHQGYVVEEAVLHPLVTPIDLYYVLDTLGLLRVRLRIVAYLRVTDVLIATPTPLGRYLSFGSVDYGYDGSGNRKSAVAHREITGAVDTTYTYDYADRLIAVDVTTPDGQPLGSVRYTYDALGRQVARQELSYSQSSGLYISIVKQTRRRFFSEDQMIEQRVIQGDGGPQEMAHSLVYGRGAADPLQLRQQAPDIPDADYFYVLDGRDRVFVLATADGAVVAQYNYDEWSGEASLDDRTATSASDISNPLVGRAALWDDRLYFTGDVAYDPTIAQPLNPNLARRTPGNSIAIAAPGGLQMLAGGPPAGMPLALRAGRAPKRAGPTVRPHDGGEDDQTIPVDSDPEAGWYVGDDTPEETHDSASPSDSDTPSVTTIEITPDEAVQDFDINEATNRGERDAVEGFGAEDFLSKFIDSILGEGASDYIDLFEAAYDLWTGHLDKAWEKGKEFVKDIIEGKLKDWAGSKFDPDDGLGGGKAPDDGLAVVIAVHRLTRGAAGPGPRVSPLARFAMTHDPGSPGEGLGGGHSDYTNNPLSGPLRHLLSTLSHDDPWRASEGLGFGPPDTPGVIRTAWFDTTVYVNNDDPDRLGYKVHPHLWDPVPRFDAQPETDLFSTPSGFGVDPFSAPSAPFNGPGTAIGTIGGSFSVGVTGIGM